MLRTVSLWLALLNATAPLAAQSFQLGLQYSAPVPTGPITGTNLVSTAMDEQRDVLVLMNGASKGQPNGGTSSVVKSSAAGAVVYQTSFASYAAALAVDPSGNAYVAVANIVTKINPSGSTVYQTTVGGPGLLVTAIALDNSGRL